MKTNFPAQVLLIGGSSGTGKTRLARSLSQAWGIPTLQVDDFRLVLRRVVEQAQIKEGTSQRLWDQLGLRAIPEVGELFTGGQAAPESMAEGLIAVAKVMSDAIEIVIAHHIATRTPVIIEGDGLLPALLTRRPIDNLVPQAGQLQGIFLVADDEAQLFNAALERGRGFAEASRSEQECIAHASWLFGQWLKAQAEVHSAPVVCALPFETLAERALRVLQD